MKVRFNFKFIHLGLFFLSLSFGRCKSDSYYQLTLGSLFQDHMVLQQDTMVSIWGKTNPKTKVELKSSKRKI